MAKPPLIGAVDIGTVSTRLIVARTRANGTFDVLERQARITDLGAGVDAAGRLAPDAVQRTLDTVAAYLKRARTLVGPDEGLRLACTTTSAARDAANAPELLEPLRAWGLAPQVIAGTTEASLALLGVTGDFGTRDVLVADVGGGSTELTAGRRGEDGRLVEHGGASYNVGCRRVTERFFPKEGPASAAQTAQARSFVARTLEPHFAAGSNPLPRELACVGGTVTTLVSVAHALEPYDPAFVHLQPLGRTAVRELAERLLSMTVEQRAALPGVQPKRAGVIAAGALIVDVLMELGGWDAYVASESDSLWGLLACVQSELEGAPSPIGWEPAAACIV